jgi:hypothetical protein
VTWAELVRERIEGKDLVTLERSAYNAWYRSIDLYRLLGGNIIPTMCLLYRRDILKAAGPYREDLPVLGDLDFNIRCLLAADIAVIPKILAYYHQREARAPGDIDANSIGAVGSAHERVGAALRNDFLRRHLAERPNELGPLAALSRGQVQGIERLNEVENFLSFRVAQAIERLNQVEAFLSHRTGEAIERLDRVETLLMSQIAERSGGLERREERRLDAELGVAAEAARPLRALLRPARAVWRGLLPARRLIARLRGRR